MSESAPRSLNGVGREPINTFTVMEDVLEKLKILDYEEHVLKKRTDLRSLSHTYFALSGKPSEQFPYYSYLISFLLGPHCLNIDFAEWSEFDDPNSVCTSILDSLRKLHFPYVSEFPASKLRYGWGEGALLTLDFLCDRALEYKRFRLDAPVYPSADAQDDMGSNEQADQQNDEIGDEVPEHEAVEDDALNALGDFDVGAPAYDPEDEERRAAAAMLESKVSPKDWLLELERVGPKLKFKATQPANEWRTHLEQASKYGETLNEITPTAKNQLEKIGGNLRKAVERIQAKERHINKEFDHLGGEFKGKQAQLDSIQEQYNILSKEVGDLSVELSEKSDAVDLIKSSMSERNNTMTDTSPLRKLSNALADLRKEIQGMELRIGVVAQTLMTSKMKHHAHQHANKQEMQTNNRTR